MNNLLSYKDYFNEKNLETIVYTQEVNEGFFKMANKLAKFRIKGELSEEIEMSKKIMDGIRAGLESLNDNFDDMKNTLGDKQDVSNKGEKTKALEEITKLIEQSRKQTWDINDLLNEGEIDYAGFTADVGLASIAYFGILLFPIRMSIIVHKGYRYFFELVKNTIRKSLVMLQLNFDQFENLIITKSFQSMDYIQEIDSNEKVSEFYTTLQTELFGKKGSLKGKRGATQMEKQLQLARDAFKAKQMADKQLKQSENAYNCLSQYENTYTKSLETLRQYTQEDTQKHLDAIKNGMNKFAQGDVDLVAYGELLCACAEEHAYRVSASIYSRFAKMTEVFNLSNQKKLIELIQASTKEKQDAAEKERKKKLENDKLKADMEAAEEVEKEGVKIFTGIKGVTLGEIDKETHKYSDITGADKWTYEEFESLDKETKDTLEGWLLAHPEVLEKCDKTLIVAIPVEFSRGGYFDYVDSLVSVLSNAIIEETNESYILNFYDFTLNEDSSSGEESGEQDNKGGESGNGTHQHKHKKSGKKYLNLSKCKDHLDDIKSMYVDNKDIAIIALKVIGEKILKDKSFVNKYSEDIVEKINKAYNAKKTKKVEISDSTYNILVDAIKELKEQKSHDYPVLRKDDNEQKSQDNKKE